MKQEEKAAFICLQTQGREEKKIPPRPRLPCDSFRGMRALVSVPVT